MTDAWAVVAASLIGFTASPLVAWLTNFFNAGRERKSMERDARYLAVRVAVILEQFAMQCSEQVSDHEMHQNSSGHAGQLNPGIPDLPPYPDEAEWKTLEPNLLADALSFRNQCSQAKAAIAYCYNIDSGPDSSAIDEANVQCGACGYVAWQIAENMRRRYKLPPFDSVIGANTGDLLRPLYNALRLRINSYAGNTA